MGIASIKIGITVAIVGVLAAIAVLPVAAQEELPPVPPDAVGSETTAAESSSRGDGAPDREARLEAIKEKRKAQLTEFQARRITNRCKAAQNKLAALLNGDQAKVDAYVAAYTRIGAQLSNLVIRLQSAGATTTTLEQVVIDYQNDANALEVEMNDYLTTLKDLSEFDCEADPEAFQAALVEIRENRARIKRQLQELRSFLQTEVKAALVEARQQLGGVNSDETETNDDETDANATDTNVNSPTEQ